MSLLVSSPTIGTLSEDSLLSKTSTTSAKHSSDSCFTTDLNLAVSTALSTVPAVSGISSTDGSLELTGSESDFAALSHACTLELSIVLSSACSVGPPVSPVVVMSDACSGGH